MERSSNKTKIIAAIVLGTLAGAALTVLLRLNKGKNIRREIVGDTKDLAKKLRKKAQKKAKNMRKEDWLAQEKEKIMNRAENTYKG